MVNLLMIKLKKILNKINIKIIKNKERNIIKNFINKINNMKKKKNILGLDLKYF